MRHNAEKGILMFEIVRITPEVARQYLSHNTRNIRPINRAAVRQYANSMINGTWQQNGETIKFYQDGTLFDGQHRLLAIIESNVPQDMLVVRDVPNNVSITDIGRPRSAKTIADSISGQIVSKNIISAAKIIVDGIDGVNKSETPKESIAQYAVDNIDLLRESYSLSGLGKSNSGHLTRRAYVVVLLYCYLRTTDDVGKLTEKIRRFITVINTGFYENDKETPAIVLRNYLLEQTSKSNSSWIPCASVVDQAFSDFQTRQRRKRYIPNKDIVGKINAVRKLDGLI